MPTDLAQVQAAIAAAEARQRQARVASLGAGLDARTQVALVALPTLFADVAAGLGLDVAALDAAVAAGALARDGDVYRADDETRRRLLDGLGADPVAAVVALGHDLAPLAAPPALARWGALARLAGDPDAFAATLLDKARSGADGVRWVEAGRALERLLGGRLRLGVLRAARALLLADRRDADRRALRDFVPPKALEAAFNDLWHPNARALHLLGAGGVGKTTFLRHLAVERAPAMGAVVAHLDFDHLDPDYPERDPGLLLAHLAEDLLLQAEQESVEEGLYRVGRVADRLREGLSGTAGGDAADVEALVKAFGDALADIGGPIVLIFDTCEELARRRADGRASRAVEETLRRVDQLCGRASNVRVILSGRWALPPTPWLAVVPVVGFDAADADRYLDQRAGRLPDPPAWQTRPAIRGQMLTRSALGDGRYSPFELNWLAGWVESEPALEPADLGSRAVDRYVEQRVLGRLHDPDVRSLLPCAAVIGTVDRALLEACVDLDADRLADAFDELGRQEWAHREGERVRLDARVRDRLAPAAGPDRDAAIAALRDRLLGEDAFTGLLARWLELEPAEIKEDWERIVAHVEATERFAWLAREVGLVALRAGHPLAVTATADALAADRWLDRPVTAEAWTRLMPLATPPQRLLLLAGAAAAAPAEHAGPWIAALTTAPAEVLADARVVAGCLAAARALPPVRGAALAVARLDDPLAAALAGDLYAAQGERAHAERAWRRALATPGRPTRRLYLPGDPGQEATRRALTGLVPAHAPAAEVLALPGVDAADPAGGALRARYLGPSVPFEQLGSLQDMGWLAAEARAHALRTPGQAAAALQQLAQARDLLRRLSKLQHLVEVVARAGADVALALRVPDEWGFGDTLAATGAVEDFDRVTSLERFCGAVFDTVRPCEEPDATHVLWRHAVEPTALLPRLAEHQAAGTDLQLDAWEAARLADFDDVTLMLGLSPYAPERSLRRALRGGMFGLAEAEAGRAEAAARLGPLVAGAIALEEAERAALRLPKDALGLFDHAAGWCGEAGDAFGVLRARLGQALAAMAVPDVEAVSAARRAVVLTDDTPGAWRQRAALVEAWLAEGGRLGGRARALLAAWSGPRPPLLPRIEIASPVAPAQVPAGAVLHFNDGAIGRTVSLPPSRPLTIGRRPDCDVQVNSPAISRRHAQVLLGPGGVTVTDLKSASGVYVADRHVQEATVGDGERFRLGPIVFTVQLVADAPVAAPSREPPRTMAPASAPPPPVEVEEHVDLEDVFQKALAADLAEPERRGLLLAGLEPRLQASLPRLSRPADQLRSDLQALQRLEGTGGATPLKTWLKNAERMSSHRPEGAWFGAAARVGAEASGVRLRLEVPPLRRVIAAALDERVDVRWRLDAAAEASGQATLLRPGRYDDPVPPDLAEAVRALAAAPPERARLALQGGADVFPWEALLGGGRWLPVVRAGGGRDGTGRLAHRQVVAADPADLRLALGAWAGEPLDAASLARAEADVLHLVVRPAEYADQVRVTFAQAEQVQGSRSAADGFGATELVGSRPPTLCVLQLPPTREGGGGRWKRYEVALLRRLAQDLGRLGVPWIVVLPALAVEHAADVLRRLARADATAQALVNALSASDDRLRGELCDAALVGPD